MNGRLGPQVLTRDFADGPATPAEHETETTKAFPRYKMLEAWDEVQITLNSAAKSLRQSRNANEDMQTPPAAVESVVLTKDARCANPRYEMVFTDISKGKGITASNRRLFVREKDGTLRTADQDERNRLNQMYFPRQNNPLRLPIIFEEDDTLAAVLLFNRHPSILDSICKVRPADSPMYISTHIKIYEDIDSKHIFSLLQDTVHWYGFCRWAIAERKIDNMLMVLLQTVRLKDADALAKCVHTMHPNIASAKKVAAPQGTSKPYRHLREYVFASTEVKNARLLTNLLDRQSQLPDAIADPADVRTKQMNGFVGML